ncbi:MAG: hypothetical protein NTY13_05340 [Chlamydiae bacterium]|nr:hypothetical protein [Chlamydiota bacterium]
MNHLNRLDPKAPQCPADNPLSFSETILRVSQVFFITLGFYRALQGADGIRACLTARVGTSPVIPDIRRDLDAWVATQGHCNEVAKQVKDRILECYLNDPFELDISGLAVSSLPACLTNLNLKKLECINCPLLETLPNLPNCMELYCSFCPLIEVLPDLPTCTWLYCCNCPRLTALPNLPMCTDLDCYRCSLLEALPELPNCTYLDCYSCLLLASLPELPLCVQLDCSGCPLLAVLPELPNCTHLDSSGCSLLRELPQLNAEVRVLSAINSRRCIIRWKDLNESPQETLMNLLPHLKKGFLPNIIFSNDDGTPQEGSDLGGLSSHLMSELFAQLSKCRCIPENPGTKLLRPTSDAPHEFLEAIGLLFVQATTKNLPIGQIFDPAFFRDLKAFHHQNLRDYKRDPQAWIEEQYRERNPHIPLAINDYKDPEDLKQDFSEHNIPASLNLKDTKLFVLNAHIKSNAKTETSWYQAAFAIASAMEGALGTDWESLCALSVDKFQARIEGLFSKEAFKAAITWQGSDDVSTKAYLLNWINTHEDVRVKDLLQFATGSRSLTGEPVIVMISAPTREGTFPFPTSHTCVRQLCLPTGYSSQGMFDDKVNESLESAKVSGFLFA